MLRVACAYEDDGFLWEANGHCGENRVPTRGGLAVPGHVGFGRGGGSCVQESADAQRTPSECGSACRPLPVRRETPRRVNDPFVLPSDDRTAHEGPEAAAVEDFPSSPIEASTAASSRRESCRQFLPSAGVSLEFPHFDALLASATPQPPGSTRGAGHTGQGARRDAVEAENPQAERRLFLEPPTASESAYGFGAVSGIPRPSLMKLESVLHEGTDASKPPLARPTHDLEGRHHEVTYAVSCREPTLRSLGAGAPDMAPLCVRPKQGALTSEPQPEGWRPRSRLVAARCGVEGLQGMRCELELEHCTASLRNRRKQESEKGGIAPSEEATVGWPDLADGAEPRRASLPCRLVPVNGKAAADNRPRRRRCDSPLILCGVKEAHDYKLHGASPSARTSSARPSGLFPIRRPPVRGVPDTPAGASRRGTAPASLSCVEGGRLRVQRCSRCTSEVDWAGRTEDRRASRSETLCRACWRSREMALWQQLTDWRACINGIHFLSLQKHYKYQLPNQEDSAAFSIHNKIEKRIFFVVTHTSEPAAAYLPGGWHMSLYLPNPTIQRDVLDVTDPKSTDAFTAIRADLPCGQSLLSYVSRPVITVNELVHCGESRTTIQKVLGYISTARSPSTALRIYDAKRHKILDIVRRTKGSKNRRLPQEWVAYRQNKSIAVKITLFLDEYKSIAGRDATIHFDDSTNSAMKMLAIVCLSYIQLLSFGRCAGAEI
ncbi:conserved hypothetical protein [Neospora caninum Liverpool]|uniref:Uncharacterized protein n=1 Tax=Neospora caninum (strain Liverpool) TaxID=572307 RepID=F0V7K8_NEOCL|nr:conserved hypothetical protein [Neospora caninum Liverpool]CBZ49699.1 conserved hypothetical protein [Neospora caninum Liverpool]CEL64284.1 TPA: hypothetical protein BN1204_001870 [Neospora caninum Liverpool]|eukprot:XP_003879734.1 conserved hypothetical protein [Neospora caninum Liverpool]